MRKILSTLLVAVMVLGLVSTAFAATTTPSTVAGAKFSDIAGNDAEADITLLAVRNILKGDAGATTVRPDSTITRAEFAAMIVRMLGKDSLATSLASMKPATKDEIPTWAWGYVNVAQNMGIMKGDPDGSFRPSDNVTFAEALAMLERAIGWDITATGSWPTNYLLVAYDLGLDDGVEVFANTPATRGEVAIMMVNAMNTQKLKGIAEDGTENKVASILAGVTVEGLVSAVAPSTNDITINFDNDDDDVIESNPEVLATSVSLVGAKTFNDLLNVNVVAIMNADDEIVYMEVVDDANVIVGTFEKWDENDDDEDVIVVDGKDYVVNTADVAVKYNTETILYTEANTGTVANDLIAEDDTVVLNLVDDEVVFIDATNVNAGNAVADADVSYSSTTKLYTLSTDGGDFTASKDMAITIDGVAKKLSDIEENDVVYVTTAYDHGTDDFTTDDILKVEAFRATVKGEVTKVRVAGTTITVTLKLADGTIKPYVLSVITRQPAIGSTVEYRLNAAGRARYEVNAVAATSVVYVVDVYTENTGTSHDYAVLDVNGESKTYEVTGVFGTMDEDTFGRYTLTNGIITGWTPVDISAVEEYTVVSIDKTNNVVVLQRALDDSFVAMGTGAQGLAVYTTDDNNDTEGDVTDDTFTHLGAAELSVDDTVWATNGVLYLIIVE